MPKQVTFRYTPTSLGGRLPVRRGDQQMKYEHSVRFNRFECTWQVERTNGTSTSVVVEYREERQARILAELMNAFDRLERLIPEGVR
jgi:hypothetical protein